jgi:hypothetical protein
MAKLRRRVIITTIRFEETEELTPQQVELWKTDDYDTQEEVMDEVDFWLSHDKVLEDTDYPELIEDEDA